MLMPLSSGTGYLAANGETQARIRTSAPDFCRSSSRLDSNVPLGSVSAGKSAPTFHGWAKVAWKGFKTAAAQSPNGWTSIAADIDARPSHHADKKK